VVHTVITVLSGALAIRAAERCLNEALFPWSYLPLHISPRNINSVQLNSDAIYCLHN